LLGLGVTAWAATTATHFNVKGDTVIALFEAADPQDSCLEDTVFVAASETMEKLSPEGHPTSTLRTMLVVTERDVCTGTALLSGEGEAFQVAFQVAGNQSSATLTATVPVFDGMSAQIIHFDVNLTWTATDQPIFEQSKEIFRDRDLGIFVVAQFRGRHAPAEATGTVVGLGLNFTPEPSVSAELQTENDGTLLIEMTM
jgi:hypothetical protein